MKQQQGAALVIVLSLLAGALIIGISGMNSALIDERLAGNYRATVQAQMNAEIIASEIFTDVNYFYSFDKIDCEYSNNNFGTNRADTEFLNISDYSDVDEGIGRFAPCDNSVNSQSFLIEGIVGDIDSPIALHVLEIEKNETGFKFKYQ